MKSTDVTYNSYEVQDGTPGAKFLSTYQLTQTQCGPAGSRRRLRSGKQRRVRAAQQPRRRGVVSARYGHARPHTNQRSTRALNDAGDLAADTSVISGY